MWRGFLHSFLVLILGLGQQRVSVFEDICHETTDSTEIRVSDFKAEDELLKKIERKFPTENDIILPGTTRMSSVLRPW